jgi:DNA-binding protein Fis
MSSTEKAPARRKPTIKEILEEVIDEMVDKGIFWPEVCAQFEKLYVLRVLEKSEGSIHRAAELMGVHRNTLSKKIKEYEINRAKIRKQGTRIRR